MINDMPFVATRSDIANRMLKMAGVKEGHTVLDLGSGDGRILIQAAKYGARAIGVELREDLIEDAKRAIKTYGLNDRIDLIRGDMFSIVISKMNPRIVTLYLDESSNARLAPKLESELKSGTYVVSHDFEIEGWKKIRTHENAWYRIHLYEIGKH